MLRNRQEQDQARLKGADLISEESDLTLGSFTLLTNWIPTKVYSLKKKRGVVAFTSTVITPATPNACA